MNKRFSTARESCCVLTHTDVEEMLSSWSSSFLTAAFLISRICFKNEARCAEVLPGMRHQMGNSG